MPRSRSVSINSLASLNTPEEFYNMNSSPNRIDELRFTPPSTPPRQIHPNITIRVPVRARSPNVSRRLRSLTMDDDEIYSALLDLGNDMNSNYSSVNDNDSFIHANNEMEAERYGINASVPFSYERNEPFNIEELSTKTLPIRNRKIKIEKIKTVYDPIMMEDTNVQSYINEDVDNIVFLYENDYYISTKSRLMEIINMTTTDNAIVFDCRGIGYRNVNHDYPYVLINKLGIVLNEFTNVISLENAIAITKASSGQYFIIKGTDEVLISTVTDNVLNGKYPNALGASHCQQGKSAIVFDIQTFQPKYYSKSSKTRKSKSPKSKKTRKMLK